MCVAVQGADFGAIRVSAMWAIRPIGPALRFEVFSRLVRVGEAGIGEVHGVSSENLTTSNPWLCQPYNRQGFGRFVGFQWVARLPNPKSPHPNILPPPPARRTHRALPDQCGSSKAHRRTVAWVVVFRK